MIFPLNSIEDLTIDGLRALIDMAEREIERQEDEIMTELSNEEAGIEDEVGGDDLCDNCMSSAVVVSHTDENGDTVCVECAEDSK